MMTRERAGRLAWIAPALTVACVAGYFALYPKEDREGVEALFGLAFVAYAAVGALIAARHPGNPVGWLFCAVGLFSAGSELAYAYARNPNELPGAEVAAWVAAWTAEPGTLVIVLLLLLFPTGRFLSRRWRAAALAASAAMAAWALALAFDPGPLRNVDGVVNPVGIEGAGALLDVVAAAGVLILLLSMLVGAAGVIVRFRRARGEERRQLKWLALAGAYAGLALLGVLALVLIVDTDGGGWDFVTALLICSAIAAFPLAAGVAILRDRLYDIDVVIHRTLVYGALTATLGGVYASSVLIMGLVLGPITRESDLAVAVATLTVAALVRPARTRIQSAVDRRFYRRRYDAVRTLSGFGARLRDQLDVDSLSVELRAVVRETVQPEHVSLWLRRSDS